VKEFQLKLLFLGASFSHPYIFYLKNISQQARHQWLMPIILATKDAEIRNITVWSQLEQIVCETLSQKYPSQKKGWWSGSRCRLWVQTPVPHTHTHTHTHIHVIMGGWRLRWRYVVDGLHTPIWNRTMKPLAIALSGVERGLRGREGTGWSNQCKIQA
jgi:hypothetical protein